jgi:hypothetical protein
MNLFITLLEEVFSRKGAKAQRRRKETEGFAILCAFARDQPFALRVRNP